MMNPVYILGTGATAVGEHYRRSLADLAIESLRSALDEVPFGRGVQALYVANALGEALAGQSQLGAALAGAAGLSGNIEALRVEAGGASGGLALRQGLLAIASGAHDLVAVVGVEKVTDRLEGDLEAGQALATESDLEAAHGTTLTALWALVMRRYLHQYTLPDDAFAPFPVNAHANAASNPRALYRFPINVDKYRKAPQIAAPLNMLDCSTLADGAATVLLASERLVNELVREHTSLRPVRIAGSAVATDTLALQDRRDLLWLEAAHQSAQRALGQAGIDHAAVDVLELTDPHGIAAALALESSGFVDRGAAPAHAADGGIAPGGATPLATSGGYKARGDAGGASGVYQILELTQQLRGQAGKAQVPNARVGFAQCLGGIGATAVSHVLIAD